jgi:hypothetical protein
MDTKNTMDTKNHLFGFVLVVLIVFAAQRPGSAKSV